MKTNDPFDPQTDVELAAKCSEELFNHGPTAHEPLTLEMAMQIILESAQKVSEPLRKRINELERVAIDRASLINRVERMLRAIAYSKNPEATVEQAQKDAQWAVDEIEKMREEVRDENN